jgi:hypothetical protein
VGAIYKPTYVGSHGSMDKYLKLWKGGLEKKTFYFPSIGANNVNCCWCGKTW